MQMTFPIVYKVVSEEDPTHIVGEIIRKDKNVAITKIDPNASDGPFAFIAGRRLGKTELDEKITEMYLKERVIDPHYQGIALYLKGKRMEYWDLWDLIEADNGISSRDKFAIYREDEWERIVNGDNRREPDIPVLEEK